MWEEWNVIRVNMHKVSMFCRFFVLCGGCWRRFWNHPKTGNHVTSRKATHLTRTCCVMMGVVWKGKTAARRPERLGDQWGDPSRMPSGCTTRSGTHNWQWHTWNPAERGTKLWLLYYYNHMFRGYYGWHHMFIWPGVQIEILRVTEHDICSSGAVTSLGAKLDIFTHFEAQFRRCSIVVMMDDKMPIGSVQRVIWRVTEHMVVIVQYPTGGHSATWASRWPKWLGIQDGM